MAISSRTAAVAHRPPPLADPTGRHTSASPRTISPRDHVYGDPRGVIQVVIYGDLCSPATAAVYGAVHDAVFLYGCFRMTIRYLLPDDDPLAQLSAAAAEAVAPFALYWPFVDLVFREGADETALHRHCRMLGIEDRVIDDERLVERCAARFAEDRRLAEAAGVTGGAAVLINGVPWHPKPDAPMLADLRRLAEVTRPLWSDPDGRLRRQRP